uniref:synaptonemal complex protein 3-like n=1 Tax=Jaculus jaculus TaxID=51337 RepID=UPI0003333567|nr:synaptonemal complex protein 3-like [Jaculus jaculus]
MTANVPDKGKTPKDKPLQIVTLFSDTSSEEHEHVATQNPVENIPPIGNSQESISSIQEEQQARNNVQRMFQELQGDIIRSFVAKSKRFQRNTNASLKTLSFKLKHIVKTQKKKRDDIHSKYSKILLPLFEQWENDVQNYTKEEEKFLSMCQEKAKSIYQARMAQQNKFEESKKFYGQLLKSIKDMEENNRNIIIGEESKVKKEMDNLKKELLNETQHQDMEMLEKFLESLLPESDEERMST